MKRLHNSGGFSAVEVLIILVVLGLVALAGWLVHSHTTSSPQQSSDNRQQLYAQVKEKLAGQPNLVTSTNDWSAQMGSGVILDSPGYDYSLSSEMFASLQIGPTADYNSTTNPSDVAQSAVQSVLAQAGYHKSRKSYQVTGYAAGDKTLPANSPYLAYEKGSSTCVSIYPTLSCFTSSDVAAGFAKANQYIAAYRSALHASNSSLVFGPMTVKSQDKSGVIGPSQTPNYDISEAIVADGSARSIVLFYKKGAGSWVYVTKAMDEFGFSCDAYAANADTTRAFYGQVCLGPNGQIHFGTGTKATQ